MLILIEVSLVICSAQVISKVGEYSVVMCFKENKCKCLDKMVNMIVMPPVEHPILPTFAGKDFEEPGEYLLAARRYLGSINAMEDQYVEIIAEGLEHHAATWFSAYEDQWLPWLEFCHLLLEKYDSEEVRTNLRYKAICKRHENEIISMFVAERYLLLRRVFPNTHTQLLITMIKHLLNPIVRKYLQNKEISGIRQLIEEVGQFDNKSWKNVRKNIWTIVYFTTSGCIKYYIL